MKDSSEPACDFRVWRGPGIHHHDPVLAITTLIEEGTERYRLEGFVIGGGLITQPLALSRTLSGIDREFAEGEEQRLVEGHLDTLRAQASGELEPYRLEAGEEKDIRSVWYHGDHHDRIRAIAAQTQCEQLEVFLEKVFGWPTAR